MNEALKMQISAFVDGELPDNEAELLLRRLSQDAALRQQVAEFLEIGRLIRRDRAVPGMDGLRERINEALGEEPLPVRESEPAVGSRFMTPASGIAVAATVAAVALVGLSQLDTSPAPDYAAAVAIDLAPTYTEPDVATVLSSQPSELVRDYYRRHGNSSSDFGSNGMLTRMVNFEVDENELIQIEPDPHLVQDAPASGQTAE